MDAIHILLDEHKLLMKAIETTRQIQKVEDNKFYHKSMNDMILFFRNFSETYHHPKEENILYPALQSRSANLSPEFIHEICDNHEDFKWLMAAIENAFVIHDYKLLRDLASQYIAYMEEHIKKENKIILSVAKELLDEKEMESISKAFVSHDEKSGDKEELIKNFYKMNLELA